MQERSAITKHAARGPYRSGEETRQRLISTALGLFGAQGFEGTSTREIAARTGVALPAIAYHFGGKEGLHLACAQHVVERYRARMLGGTEGMHPAKAGALNSARAALRQIMALLTEMLLDVGDDDGWMTFMLREMNGSGAARDLLYRDLWAPGLALVADHVASCRGRSVPDASDRLEALLLLSSLTVFSTARKVALDFGGWPTIDRALVAQIADQLGERIDHL